MQIENNVDESWKTKALILGAVLGAVLGLASAYLMTRTADETGGKPPEVSTGDVIKTSIAAIGLIRGIASLGEGRRG
jgi:H+/Cl- antiporter ClcA